MRWPLVPLVVLAAAVCPTAVAQEASLPLAAVQEVLDRRAEAVRAGDRAAWLATVDPEAPAAFRRAQERSFDGWRSVPLVRYELAVRVADSGDLGAAAAGRYGGAPVFLPETRQLHRLDDYDDRDAVDSLWLTFVRREGRWYVGGDDDLSDVGLDTGRTIWELGPVEVQPTEHFLVISHPEEAARATELARLAEEAVALLRARWTRPWAGRIPLVVPASGDELETILQSTFDLDHFVAFVVYGVVRDEGYAAGAPRVYVHDRNLSRHPRSFQLRTLVHELAHAAAVPLIGPQVPAWVHEGMAEWIASGRSTDARRPAGSDGRLPRDHEFSTGTQVAILGAYGESRSAVSSLARDAGVEAPFELLAAIGERRIAPGSEDFAVDVALRRVAQRSLDEFERNWADR